MTEILTESFCERCGTRYTFEPVETRKGPLKTFGTLGRGLRHFVSDPSTSLDEAFAVARSEQEQRATSQSLEAFHRTFNFCLTCRQYTCGDCWNAVEGRCLTCAPTPESLEQPALRMDTSIALPQLDLAQAGAPIGGAPDTSLPPLDAGPWIGSEEEIRAKLGIDPEADARAAAEAAIAAEAERLDAEEEARIVAEREAAEAAVREAAEAALRAAAEEAEAARLAAEAEAQRVAAEEAEAARLAAEEAEAARLAEEADAARLAAEEAEAARLAEEADAARLAAEAAEAEAQAAAAAAAEEAERAALAFEPGQNLDDEIAAYEAKLKTEAEPTVPEPEPVLEPVAVEPGPVVAAPEPEPVEAEPEPVAAETEPEPVAAEIEPEPVAAEAEPEPVGTEELAEELPVAAASAPSGPAPKIEPIPTAVGQPLPASVVDGPLAWPEPGAAAAAFEPHWPDIPTPRRAAPQAPPPQVVAVRRTGANLPSVTAPTQQLAARACPSCGLSLSASARFCRRCGTPQQVGNAP
jgi:hypothetical protein